MDALTRERQTAWRIADDLCLNMTVLVYGSGQGHVVVEAPDGKCVGGQTGLPVVGWTFMIDRTSAASWAKLTDELRFIGARLVSMSLSCVS